jgi:hypothetical protein
LYTFVDTRKDEHIPDNRIISKHMDRLVAVGEELACDEAGVSLGVGGHRVCRSIRFNFLLSPRHFYILPTDNKKIAIGGVVFGGINCGRGKRAPTNPLWELGLGVIGQLIILDLIDISRFESKMYIQEDNWFEWGKRNG